MEWYRIKIPLEEIMTTKLINEILKVLLLETKREKRFRVLAYQDETGDKYVYIHPDGFLLCEKIMENYSGDLFDMDSVDDDFIANSYDPINLDI